MDIIQEDKNTGGRYGITEHIQIHKDDMTFIIFGYLTPDNKAAR